MTQDFRLKTKDLIRIAVILKIDGYYKLNPYRLAVLYTRFPCLGHFKHPHGFFVKTVTGRPFNGDIG